MVVRRFDVADSQMTRLQVVAEGPGAMQDLGLKVQSPEVSANTGPAVATAKPINNAPGGMS